MQRLLADGLPGLAGDCVASSVCMYPGVPDDDFVLGVAPGVRGRVVLALGFSGHGFKFMPVVGEIVADLVSRGPPGTTSASCPPSGTPRADEPAGAVRAGQVQGQLDRRRGRLPHWPRAGGSVRPEDELVALPMADGGDGTLEVLASGSLPDADWVPVPAVDAVGAARKARYLRSGDTAAVELAEVCGIAGLDRLEPMGAHTIGLGIVLAAAVRAGARRVVVAVGGSASTDGGAGALSALGAQLVGAGGLLPVGVAGGWPGWPRMRHRPAGAAAAGGVQVLVDVRAPLFGPSGAASVFGPQKGASSGRWPSSTPACAGWRRCWAPIRTRPGCGAAGGTGYGLAWWGGELVPGAAAIAELVGLADQVARADWWSPARDASTPAR